MRNIINKQINGKEAKLVIDDSNTMCVIYNNIQIDNNLGCKISDVLGEKWIGEALIDFAVHDYIYKVEHKSEFEKLEKLMD